MEIGQASPEDYAGILRLQAANYLGNLRAEDRQGGFLSTEFTLPQIGSIAADLGIVVARDAGRVVAYVCAHRADMTPLPPVVEVMLRCARTAYYRGRALADAPLFVYGPVCIDRAQRGRGLLRRIYGALLTTVAGRYEVGVTLVSQDNPHSLRAHVSGLGMDEVAHFDHAGRGYHVLAFHVPPV